MSADPALELQVFTSPTRPIGKDGGTFSPVTSTLILGPTEVVLVDAQFIKSEVEALGDMIQASGRRLTTIFITHAHADHYFGINQLSERFPGVNVVATPEVADDINDQLGQHLEQFGAWFGDDLARPTEGPKALTENVINIDGEALRVIAVDQADIAPTAVLFVPSLSALIVGDLAYDRIHQMLGLTGPDEWERWADSLDAVEALAPRVIIVGHRPVDAEDSDAPRILAGTKAYIRSFVEATRTSNSVRELIGAMKTAYPDHGNISTLYFSAHAAVARKSG